MAAPPTKPRRLRDMDEDQMEDNDKIQDRWTTCLNEEEYFQHESDLQEKMKNCKKHPGHLEFMKISDFKRGNLPEGHCDELVWDFIQTVIFLTVRLVASYTSTARPDDYVDAKFRGKHIGRVGSGMVRRVRRKFMEKDGKTCPCTECLQKSPDQRKTKWGGFEVDTACHVIFDNLECENSRCDVGFDHDEDIDKCSKLYGVKVTYSDIKEDRCKMDCVTHDENLYNKMAEMCRRFYYLRDKLTDKYMETASVKFLSELPVVCVSHPHGMCKRVTVGMAGNEESVEPYKWSYTTQTCPGSSGASVFTLGRWDSKFLLFGRHSVHSGCNEAGENQCGDGGWWLVR